MSFIYLNRATHVVSLIPALFGIPPMVLGLMAGLEHSSYNNLTVFVKQAWNACMIPVLRIFAATMTRKLLPFYPGSEGKVIAYDLSGVRELQDDLNDKRNQARLDKEAGIITLAECRSEQGRETTPEIEAQLKAEHEAPVDPATDPKADPKADAKRQLRRTLTPIWVF